MIMIQLVVRLSLQVLHNTSEKEKTKKETKKEKPSMKGRIRGGKRNRDRIEMAIAMGTRSTKDHIIDLIKGKGVGGALGAAGAAAEEEGVMGADAGMALGARAPHLVAMGAPGPVLAAHHALHCLCCCSCCPLGLFRGQGGHNMLAPLVPCRFDLASLAVGWVVHG